MKKSYIKPTVFVEHLAMKSSISTCGYVSTTKIEDGYTCHEQFYNPMQEGGLCEKHEGSPGPNVATYDPNWETTLICFDNGTCDECYYCYHVPDQLDGTSKAYVGLS